MDILFLIAGSVLAVVMLAMRQSDVFKYTRSLDIDATPDRVFPLVNSMRQFNTWNPWAREEPNAQNEFSTEDEAIGSYLSWSGNRIGKGRMTKTSFAPNQFIQMRLDFEKPMKATNIAEFTFTPIGNKTRVTWSMEGKGNFVSKFFGLLMNCDKMIGTSFEQGLLNLREMIEGKKQ